MGVIQERTAEGKEVMGGSGYTSGGFAIKENREIRQQLKGIVVSTIIVKVAIIGCLCCVGNYLA